MSCNFTSGSKERLAIQCVVLDQQKGLGNVYFWVGGHRFGTHAFPFELETYFYIAIDALGRLPLIPAASSLSSSEYLELVDWLYDQVGPAPHVSFSSKDEAERAVDATIWRDYYAADSALIGIIGVQGGQVVHAINGARTLFCSARVPHRSFQYHMRAVAAWFASISPSL